MIRHQTFLLAGYHRHADVPVCKVVLEFEQHELDGLSASHVDEMWRSIRFQLGEAAQVGLHRSELSAGARPEERLAAMFAVCCIALQHRIGHRVEQRGVIAGNQPGHSIAWYEYDHPDAAVDVCELVEAWLGELLDDADAVHEGIGGELPDRIEQLAHAFGELRMPADTHAIDAAARSRGLPCLRLDRPPCDPIEGSFRLRPHGLLRLGQGWRQHTVDGTFCVSRSQAAFPLVRDRRRRFERLRSLGVPLAGSHPEARWCASAARAVRAARRIGRPVVLRRLQSAGGPSAAEPLSDDDAVLRSAQHALPGSGEVLVEPYIEGDRWCLPVAGGRAGPVVVRIDRTGAHTHHQLDEIDSALVQHCESMVRKLDVGLAVVRLVASDLEQPLEESGGAVIDIDLAPRLDALFAADEAILATLAERFIDWLYPDPAEARIPVFAVTGTNGKTTTCRMLAAIFRQSHGGVGLACSDGTDVDGKTLSEEEHGYLPGHLTVLDNPHTHLAVLESTRGGAVSTGQGYDRSVAAACLNISDDHLNDHLGIRDLDEMASVKQGIVESAKQAAVLNADDRRCLAMAPGLTGRRVGLFSLEQPPERLLERQLSCEVAAAVDHVDGEEWLFLCTHDARMPVTRVADIPVCYQGRARQNIANALAALLLAYFAGEDTAAIAQGLQQLETDFDTHHGRLNFVEGLPFTLILDYAHNPEGLRLLAEFVERTPVSGRRILNFSCSGGNTDAFIREVGRAAAGGFDLYVCKPFTLKYDREIWEVPQLLREGLLEAGITAEKIIVQDHEMESIRHTLELARPGDLVVVVGGKVGKRDIWEFLEGWSRS